MMLIAPQEEVVQNKTCNNQPGRGTHYNSATNSQERMCGWLMNSTRGTKGKYGLKDKNEMVGGRRIYGQKRGIIALAHGDGVEERDNTNVS